MKKKLLLFILLLILSIFPFFLCDPLPLNDYVEHLARMHVLVSRSLSVDLQRYYNIEWSPLPNLAMDLLVPIIAKIMPIESAMVFFTILVLFLIVSGVIAVNWVLFSHKSIFPFIVFILIFNRSFLWGYLNFLFSVGCAFWAFAAWVRFRDRPAIMRLPVFTVFAILLFLFHLYGLAFYGVLVGGYEVHRSLAQKWQGGPGLIKDWGVTVGQFVLPTLVFFNLSQTGQKWHGITYDDIMGRIRGVFDPFLNYVTPLDVITGLVVGGVFVVGLFRKKLVIHPLMIMSVGILAFCYALLPDGIAGATAAGRRMIVPLSLTLVAVTDWRVSSELWRRVFIVFFLCLFAARMGVIGVNWWSANKIYADLIGLIENVEKGGRLYFVNAKRNLPRLENPPLDHFSKMAVVRRDALVNSLFVFPQSQVLRYAYPQYAPLIREGFGPHPRSYILDDLGRDRVTDDVFAYADPEIFQYLLLINAYAFTAQPPPEFKPIASARGAILYRIDAAKVK